MNKSFRDTKINLVSLAISHLKQIIEKLPSFKEDDMIKLDSIIFNYSSLRRELHQSQLANHTEASLLDQITNELAMVDKENDFAMKQLEILSKKFQRQKIKIAEQTQKIIRSQNQEYEHGSLNELCKHLILELSNYRNVDPYFRLLQEHRKETGQAVSYEFILCTNQYLKNMEEIIQGRFDSYADNNY